MLILHPYGGVEKFHAFLLPQRFLPGIQSHKGSGRKQVTGSRLPPEFSCPNFSQNVVLQSWPRAGLGERRAGGRRGKIRVLTLVLAKAQDGTRVRSSMSGASSPWLQSQMPLWYQPQSPVSSRASVCCMKCEPKIWVGLASAFLALWLPSTPCSSSADQCPQHLSRSRIAA